MSEEEREVHDRNRSKKGLSRKKVGDQTANPLPDEDYSISQPPGDDNQSNPQS